MLFRSNDKISQAKKEMLDKLIKMNPELAEQKNQLYKEFLGKPAPVQVIDKKEIVLDVIRYGDKIYFKDNNNRLLDSSVTQVGVFDAENNKCVFFNENKLSLELPDDLKNSSLLE